MKPSHLHLGGIGLGVLHNRRAFLRASLPSLSAGWVAANTQPWVCRAAETTNTPDLLSVLRQAGVPEAAREIGLDFQRVFALMAVEAGHPYRHYRWSVSYAETGDPLIQALPPEEEMGWTPWAGTGTTTSQ